MDEKERIEECERLRKENETLRLQLETSRAELKHSRWLLRVVAWKYDLDLADIPAASVRRARRRRDAASENSSRVRRRLETGGRAG